MKNYKIEEIMAYVDGELDKAKANEIEELISNNKDAKKDYQDLILTNKIYKGYTDQIISNTSINIPSQKKASEEYLHKFLNFIFPKNKFAIPVAATFLGLVIGYQFKSFDNDQNYQFRGENNNKYEEKIIELQEKIEILEKEIKKLREKLNKK